MRESFQLNEVKSGSTENLIIPNAGIGAFYFAAAFISLNLVTPPGYATAIWPAAGIALGMMLLYGPRLWPGLFIGATLVNLTNLYNPAVDPDIGQPLLLAASLGVAATLQALAGYFLVKPRINIDNGLIDANSILRLLLYGGPISCLVSASWSVATLYLGGIIVPANLVFNWVTWWAGDSVGVMLALPLLLIWFGHPREAWEHRKAGVAMPVCAAFLIVLTIYLVEIREYEEVTETRFENQAEFLADSLHKKIRQNFEVVYSLQGLFETADFVNRSEFKEYVTRALRRNPGIHALSWNPVITQARRAEFEASMQAQGFTGFRITERNEDGALQSAGEREFHVVVQFIEPLEANRKALGFDVFSNKQRKQALRKAHDSGELTGTEPITLVQESGNQAGVLFILPVVKYPSESKRQAAVADLPSGFVVGVFRIGSLLMESIQDSPIKNVIVRLRDVDDATMPKLLGDYLVTPDGLVDNADPIGADQAALYWQRALNLGNRSWILEIQAHTHYLTGSHLWTLWGVFITGLMFTVALSTFLMILSGRGIIDRNRARDLAAEIAEREAVEFKLSLANERLEIIASTDDLTQINNRRSTHDRGVRLAAEAQRYAMQYAVLMLDLDHFKAVNDEYGHKAGDQVLKDFTARVREALRDVDEFGRWGGEEFMILAKNSGPDDALEFAERLVKIVANHRIEPVGNITVSIGVAISRDGESFDELVQRADRALYRAKENGRNRVEIDNNVTQLDPRKAAT